MYSIAPRILIGCLLLSLCSCEKEILPWEVNGLLHGVDIKELKEFCVKETSCDYYQAEFHSFVPKHPETFTDHLRRNGWIEPGREEERVLSKLAPKERRDHFLSMDVQYKEIDGRRCFILSSKKINRFYCVVAFPTY